MIPDMTDHGAAPLELSDINTFLPGCGQVRQAGGAGWGFAMISPGCGLVSARTAGVTDTSRQRQLTRRKCRRVEKR